jgi:hypothetical protein
MVLNFLTGALHIFAGAMRGPAASGGGEQSGGSEEQQHYFFDHNFLSFYQVRPCCFSISEFPVITETLLRDGNGCHGVFACTKGGTRGFFHSHARGQPDNVV